MTIALHEREGGELGPIRRAVPRAARTAHWRKWLDFVLHEPFFQFLALGLLIWAGVEHFSGSDERYAIHVGPAQRQRLAMTYLLQFNQRPTQRQLDDLVERYIREEIFVREGLALNLDRDDEIVRRRIAQKFEFLQTDLAVPQTPSTAVLEQWFARHRQDYVTPQRVAFTQVYFSPDRDGDAAAKSRAQTALLQLRRAHAQRASTLGDSFPGPSDVSALAPDDAVRVFGRSEFSDRLFHLPEGEWAGPLRSGYGWHLVYVTSRQEPALPRLADIRARVLDDYMQEQRRSLSARAFAALRARYSIRQDDGP